MLSRPIYHFLPLYGIQIRYSSSSTRWIARKQSDRFTKQAARQNYRARSTYKLIELDLKYNILKKGDVAIDCGAAPGGWSQYIAEKIFGEIDSQKVYNKKRRTAKSKMDVQSDEEEDIDDKNDFSKQQDVQNGLVIAVDLSSIEPISGVNVVHGDITDHKTIDKIKTFLGNRKANAIFSDMAPNFSGKHLVDHMRSMDLCEAALSLAQETLGPGGTFLCKFLMGENDKELRTKLERNFRKVLYKKPEASRKESSEGYFVCLMYSSDVK
ncbi:6590_t:CDS:2 [Paraglomus occultum]|uniref:rRNA methyltransferase 2, mitochondrial n=1 Tax=Paraglomus occultum TaxID=144539 RepID=A0A9N9FVV4_9GLOM|nr:6590_t:CDS:2 [Paraglomus occultum]